MGRAGDDDGDLYSVRLSTDHKVDLPDEEARIISKGGWVRPARTDKDDGEFVPARMYEVEGKPWLGPGLCVSRALGDLNALRCGLIPTPEIFTHQMGAQDRFLILASDGVWEFIESGQAVTLLAKFLPDATTACTKLIETAAAKWRQEEGDYRDDITAILLRVSAISALMGEAGSSDGA